VRAQAIAARSYGYVHRRSTTYTFDVYDDARSQVYLGSLYEKAGSTSAVNDTAGVVVKYGTAVANTLFHSTAGGWTENNENVFVSSTGTKLASPVAYLRGVSDRRPDGSSYDAASSKATWSTASYTFAQLSAICANDSLTNVGTISRIDLSNRGVSGRLISITLTGSSATKTVSGPYFKYVFNVYSPVTDPAIWSTLFATAPIP
jgi:stage II sporulation protein D (peptidoglycan lytic transglycosylase)